MLRRLVPLALLAVPAVLAPAVPASAATPAAAAVSVFRFQDLYASADVPLADGSVVSIDLDRFRGSSGTSWHDSLHLTIRPCADWSCAISGGAGADLPAGALTFDKDLGTASVSDLPLDVTTYGEWPAAPRVEHTTLSATFTGTGAVSRATDHGTVCTDDGDGCRSVRVEALRHADVALDYRGERASGQGTLFRGTAVDVAPARAGSAY